MPSSGAGRFIPVHDAHAIEQVTISVQFQEPLDDAAVKSAQVAMKEHAEALPGIRQFRVIGLAVGPTTPGVEVAAPALTPTGGPDGFVRLRSAPSGLVEKEMRLDRKGARFRTIAYKRWDDVWGEARRYFGAVLGALAENAMIDAYSIQYVDKFIWQGELKDCRAQELIRRNCPYVVPRIFEAEDLWHCHSGQFERFDSHARRLVAVNLDCVDEPHNGQECRIVRIATVVTDSFNQPGFEAFELPAHGSINHIDEKVKDIHNLLKEMIVEIATPDICQRIGIPQ